MDAERFDTLSRSLGSAPTRRQALKLLIAGIGAVLTGGCNLSITAWWNCPSGKWKGVGACDDPRTEVNCDGCCLSGATCCGETACAAGEKCCGGKCCKSGAACCLGIAKDSEDRDNAESERQCCSSEDKCCDGGRQCCGPDEECRDDECVPRPTYVPPSSPPPPRSGGGCGFGAASPGTTPMLYRVAIAQECKDGEGCCDGVCMSLATEQNCGECGRRCEANQRCVNGECQGSRCSSPHSVECGGQCRPDGSVCCGTRPDGTSQVCPTGFHCCGGNTCCPNSAGCCDHQCLLPGWQCCEDGRGGRCSSLGLCCGEVCCMFSCAADRRNQGANRCFPIWR